MKRKTIRNHADFILPRDCLSARSHFFILKVVPAKIPGDARYGMVVSKRVFKLAVHRNRAKRLLRDWIVYHEDLMNPNLDYVFIIEKSILESDRDNGRIVTKKALEKIAKQYAKKQ